MRSLIIILFILFVACSGGGPDTPGEPPMPGDEPSICLAWDGLMETWRVNIGGELWETTDLQYSIDHLPEGTHESFIRGMDREDKPLRFQIEVTPDFIEIIPYEYEDHFGEPLIFEKGE